MSTNFTFLHQSSLLLSCFLDEKDNIEAIEVLNAFIDGEPATPAWSSRTRL